MSSKSDRRSIRTKKELKDNLIALLSTGRIIESISVKELADLADISRSTFYLHYSDIYDLLDDIENDFFDEFRSVFDGFHPEELTESPLPRIDGMLAFAAKNSRLVLSLADNQIDMSFSRKIKNIAHGICFDSWSQLYPVSDRTKYEYFFPFIFSGCIDLILTWLRGGIKESRQYMSDLLETFIMDGASVLRS